MTLPNIILILADDMGYSDLGCYGGEIDTPNLDRLAANGLRYSQFYNTARCSPSRASLLTGLHPHQTGIGVLTYDTGPEGYPGDLGRASVTIPEALKSAGYRSYMSGKWHVSSDLNTPSPSWPMQRGFDDFFGTITGSGSFYHPNTLKRGNACADHEATGNPDFFYTDAINDEAAGFVRQHVRSHSDQPFFLYVAHTAPHFPLHAHDEDIAKYKGRFDAGWDDLRKARLDRLVKAGILNPHWPLSVRDASEPHFSDAEHKAWLLRCMEVYAAQIDRMDQGLGRLLATLEETGRFENTLILFLSDNGGCAEDIPTNVDMDHFVDYFQIAQRATRDGREVHIGNDPTITPGGEETYQSYGRAWANLSNSPFRLYKRWVHEGGIATPLIAHWPDGIDDAGGIRHVPAQLPDVMATLLELSGAEYPARYAGHDIPPCEGTSFAASFVGEMQRKAPLFWEHLGNAAIRQGKWKLVRDYPGPWELYDMEADRTELLDRAADLPERVAEMAAAYQNWADRCGVIDREKITTVRYAVRKPEQAEK